MHDVFAIKNKDELKIASLKKETVHRIQLYLTDNSLGVPWKVPVIVIRGKNKGPILGITAALHGDELNGISSIFKLLRDVKPHKLNGTVVLVPISNIPGYLLNQRFFSDNVDLNRIMPGKLEGPGSNRYAYYFTKKLIKQFNYLLDLHTASKSRINSLYVRADLENELCRELAFLQNPQIIVQKYDEEGTLRGWANDNGIPAITIEIGNANAFQHTLIDESLVGLLNTLRFLKMIPGKVQDLTDDTTICEKSFWIYSNQGGIVDVLPPLASLVKKGQLLAKVYSVFGEVREKIYSDRRGIVIGKNTDPNCNAGTRIIHLGHNIIPNS